MVSIAFIWLLLLIFGTRADIFKPRDFFKYSSTPLLAAPSDWVVTLRRRLDRLESLTVKLEVEDSLHRAREAYVQVLKGFILGNSYFSSERTIVPQLRVDQLTYVYFDPVLRDNGLDWPYFGVTMVGSRRLENIFYLLKRVFHFNVPGDYIETGVWQGGASIFAHGVIRAYGESRRTFVCDSFAGLPAGNASYHVHDVGWDRTPFLSVNASQVAENFHDLGLLDDGVVFVRGFFKESMKPLASQVNEISVLRIDCDIYESTADVLYRLYEKVSVGGYVIIDDWFGYSSRVACEDFFAAHNVKIEVVAIDSSSVYWEKTEHFPVQQWRYETRQFK